MDTNYSVEPQGNLKAIINHFKRQAEGTGKPLIIDTTPSLTSFRNGRANKSDLILIDTTYDISHSNKNTNMPKIEMVDPSEGARRMAMGKLIREETEISNATDDYKSNHSPPRKRQSKTSLVKTKQIQASANKKVKRARDIFD